MMKTKIEQALENYWGILVLAIWITLSLLLQLVRLDAYGIDEQAARGLLLNWSVSDNLVSPILIFGVPDLRALLFVPIGAYWAGSMLAAKILAIVMAFFMALSLYKWIKKINGNEAALISSVLFCLSPAVLNEIDSIGKGTFLLLGFAVGAWLDAAYRKSNKVFGGWYFTQLLVVGITVTLHPIAVAYPLAVAWSWFKNPHPERKSLHVYIGLAIACFVALMITAGWHDIQWFTNPGISLAQSVTGVLVVPESFNSLAGGLLALALLAVLALDARACTSDLLSLMLLGGVLGGLLVGDYTWAVVALCFVIYRGMPLLIRINQTIRGNGFVSQRGIVVVVAFTLTTFFMLEAKAHSHANKLQLLSAEDELIETLATIASDKDMPFRGASQWPGKTMLACKRDILTLPPELEDQDQFVKNLKGLTHVIFDPFAEQNKGLSNSIAALGGQTETITLKKGGVIIEVRDNNVRLKNYKAPTPIETVTPAATGDTTQQSTQ